MIVLVTGGAGFIGANLVRKLVAHQLDATVHLLVEKQSDLHRLSDLLDKLVIHEIDLTDAAGVRTLVLAIRPGVIYHLASYGGMPHQRDQMTVYNVNFYGTITLLNACKEVGFSCFVNTGSSSEYGMQPVAMSERQLLEPISDYAVAKAAATQFCLKEALFNKLPVYTVRPFSVYGDYEMPTRLIPTIIANALEGKPINLSASHYVRDYIYISDMVDVLIAVTKKLPTDAFIFNGGTGVQSTIQDVVDTVGNILQKPLTVNWGTQVPRPWEPARWQADIAQTSQALQWAPRYNLHQGLVASIDWFEKHLNLYSVGHSTPSIIQPSRQAMADTVRANGQCGV